MVCRKGNTALRAMPGRQQFYTNLAKLCAVEVGVAGKLQATSLDKCAKAIIAWFTDAKGDNYEAKLERLSNLSESVLRSYIHLGLQFEHHLGKASRKNEVEMLLNALRGD